MDSEEVLEALKPKQTFGGEYARYWSRFWAFSIDGMAVSALCAVIPGGFFLLLIINWLYKALMESSPKQATLGKLATGLYVTNVGGGRITFKQASIRHWVKPVFLVRVWFACLLAYALRVVPSIKDLGAKVLLEQPFWHDRFAGTLVVKGGASGAPLAGAVRAALAGGIFVVNLGATSLKAFSVAKQAETGMAAAERVEEAKPAAPAAPAPATPVPAAPAVSMAPAAATLAGGIAKPAVPAPPPAAQPAKPAPPPAAPAPVAKAEPAPKTEPPHPPPPPAPETPKPAPAPPIDYDGVLKACESELGVFCDPESSNKPALLRCLRRNQAGLMPKCAKRLRALPQ